MLHGLGGHCQRKHSLSTGGRRFGGFFLDSLLRLVCTHLPCPNCEAGNGGARVISVLIRRHPGKWSTGGARGLRARVLRRHGVRKAEKPRKRPRRGGLGGAAHFSEAGGPQLQGPWMVGMDRQGRRTGR